MRCGRWLAWTLAWLVLAGCQAQDRAVAVSPTGKKVLSLAIAGYNYTNRYIDTFEVNGAGGGNLFVSSPTSGGGGTTWCALYMPGLSGITVTVRWQSSACTHHVKSTTSNEVFEHIYSFFKQESPPRLKLSKAREDRSLYPLCPNDQKPAG